MNGAFYHPIELLPLGLAVSVEFIGPLVLAAVLSRRPIDALWIGLATVGRLIDGAGGPAPPAQQRLLYSAQPGTRHRGYRRLAVALPRHRGPALDGNSTADGSLHGHHHHLPPQAGSGRARSCHQHYCSGRRALAQFPQEFHQLVGSQGGRRVRPGTNQAGDGVLGERHVRAHQNEVARVASAQHGGVGQAPDVLKDL